MTSPQRTPVQQYSWGKLLTAASMILLGSSLAACGAQSSGDSTASPRPSSAATTATTASPSAGTPSPTAGQAPSSAVSPTSAAPITPTDQGVPLCPASSLSGALDDSGGGAAGHIYMTLVLTNSSAAPCILDGYPGVSMVAAGSTTPIGAPAERDPQAPSKGPITLAPGDSAGATLRYTQAGNYQNCQRVQAESILVYPPSATDSLAISRTLTACSNEDIKLLSIGAFTQ
ncbi:DUF4232 domain-containing protein [Arthrobacter sp. lap29]|uniref:DUF4232 domain-containing protein n=1 Tax=Arthrobacter sp. lap29 TaxID=3056122 RepID=UPI0028F706CE|nr:DUF4232 domain-containing protein [Arthrobacter sp. lap29]